jgi:hypothetical protein
VTASACIAHRHDHRGPGAGAAVVTSLQIAVADLSPNPSHLQVMGGRAGRARHDVVGEDCRQLSLVFGLQEVLHGSGGQLRECGVGRCKDGERPGALQRIDQSGRLQRGDQRIELTGRNRGIDDVLLGAARGRAADE